MASARDLGGDAEAVQLNKEIDIGVFNLFSEYSRYVIGSSGYNMWKSELLVCDQEQFDSVYQKALTYDDDSGLVALSSRLTVLSAGVDVLSNTQLPLTPAGKLAAEGKFEEAEYLCRCGANRKLMYVGAASGGQSAFLTEHMAGRDGWFYEADGSMLKRAMLLVAGYGKHADVVKLIDEYKHYELVVKGAGLGGHFDYVEEIVTKLAQGSLVIQGLCAATFDRLHLALQNPADGLRFLVQFHDDKFRADMAWRLDQEYLASKDRYMMLPYKAVSLVEKASQIRKLMDIQSLPYDDACLYVERHPYLTTASLAAHSMFASAAASVNTARSGLQALLTDHEADRNDYLKDSCLMM